MEITPNINIIIWVYVLSFISSITIGVLLYLKRKSKGAYILAIFEFLTSFWTIGALFDTLTHDIGEKMFWSQVSYIGIVSLPLMFLAFSLDFAQYNRWLKWKYFRYLAIIPILTFLSALTNNYHHFLWESISVDPINGLGHYVYGPMFWVNAFYSYVILTTGIVILFMGLRRFPVIYAKQLIIMALASVFPFVGNIIYVFKINPVPGLDWTPICFMITGGLIAYGVYMYQVFDLIPIAQKKIVETIQEAVAVIDSKKRIIMTNPAFISSFLVNQKNILGSSIFEVLSNFEGIYNKLDAPSNVVLSQYEYNSKVFEFTHNSIFTKNNQELAKVIVFRDITQNIITQKALLKSNQDLSLEISKSKTLIADLSSFSHMVAHDLKSPLNGIQGLSDLLTSGMISEKDEITQLNNEINKATLKMSQIIDELLLLSTVQLNDISISKLNMEEILKGSITRLSTSIKEQKVTIITPSEWPTAMGYKPWVEEVWVNLITNAIKYGGNPPILEFGFDKTKSTHTWFWLKDNGDGIPPDKQNLIFEEFTRITDKKVEGHGIGLSIVKRIMKKIGGEIIVTSDNIPGNGSKFSFSLKN